MLKDNLRKLREAANLTQDELAKRANISQATISLYENGFKNPSVRSLQRLAAELNCTIDELVAG